MTTNNMPARLVILISGRGSNMRSIITAIQQQELNAHIAAVISNRPDAAGLAYATKAGIDTAVLDHRQFDNRETFDAAMADKIDQFSPDFVILAGFMRILTAAFVERYQGRLINIH